MPGCLRPMARKGDSLGEELGSSAREMVADILTMAKPAPSRRWRSTDRSEVQSQPPSTDSMVQRRLRRWQGNRRKASHTSRVGKGRAGSNSDRPELNRAKGWWRRSRDGEAGRPRDSRQVAGAITNALVSIPVTSQQDCHDGWVTQHRVVLAMLPVELASEDGCPRGMGCEDEAESGTPRVLSKLGNFWCRKASSERITGT